VVRAQAVTSFAGIGLATDAIARPAVSAVQEAAALARLADDETAAALLRVVARLLANDVPPLELLDVMERWAARVEDLGKKSEGTMLTIRHRLALGRHQEFKFAPGEDSIPRGPRRA
jgi:hypothetical protein